MLKSNRLGLFLFMVLLCWMWLILKIALAALPYNSLTNKTNNKTNRTIIAFAPQGWAFFTRNPRETQVYVYRHNGSRWVLSNDKNSGYYNYFGVLRNARARGAELSFLLKDIPGWHWNSCEEEMNEYLKSHEISEIKIKNKSIRPLLCGKMIFAQRDLIPWAWSASRDEIIMPAKIVMVDVECL